MGQAKVWEPHGLPSTSLTRWTLPITPRSSASQVKVRLTSLKVVGISLAQASRLTW